MTKTDNATSKNEPVKAQEGEAVATTPVFTFPDTGISVEAKDLAEATKKHDEIVKSQGGDNE